MCGIAGVYTDRSVERVDDVHSMVSALSHRGPDSKAFFQADRLVAGMARLSINDLEGGGQPLYSEDRSVAVLYNGEIYNSPELRHRLERQGVSLRTKSDGEVIAHLYSSMGVEGLQLLNGMFAIAIWDNRTRELMLARDPAGEKPLYYTENGLGEMAFASELKSLRAASGFSWDYNLQAVWDMPTFLWIPEPQTIYQSVFSLERGTALIIGEKGKREFSIPYSGSLPDADWENPDEVKAVIRKTVEESVFTRLLSDVPVGTFLSGGLDSSIITALCSSRLSNMDTFTIGFEKVADPYHGMVDESSQAADFAKRFATRHHEIRVKQSDFRELLGDFCHYGDQPFSVSSGLGILAICAAARKQGVPVLLSGDGADEAFGGYSWYSHLDKTSASADVIGESPNFQSFGTPLAERLRHIRRGGASSQAFAWHYYAGEKLKSSLFSPDISRGSRSSLRFFEDYKTGMWSPEDFIAQDRAFYFPFEMLRKADRMSMANSIEVRVPFASPEIQSLADHLRMEHFVKGSTLKWLLREAFADLLPQETVRRPKHGFNVPIDHWLKEGWSDLLEQSLGSESALWRLGWIQKDAYQKSFEALYHKRDLNGHALFSIVMLDMWLKQQGE